MVRIFADGTLALGWKARQMVNGVIDTYLAFVVGGLFFYL